MAGGDTMASTSSADSASTGELVNRATEQISRLVREELALARVEMVQKGKRAGIGGGLLGGATVFALYGLGLLFALCVVLLHLVWSVWLSVLVVMLVVFAIAGVAALLGRAQLKRAVPPVPKEAVGGLSEDVDVVKTAIQNGRRP
jgi:Flp pilus assembly protein TadB